MKILVADDSKTNLKLISAALKQLGHEVIAVDNGEQAIHSYQTNAPDLVILDVVMEGMNGFECAKRIRQMNVDAWIPIIFLSGSVDDDSIAKGIDAGGDDYLTKPFSEIKIAAKIKAMQRIASMRQELINATQQLSRISSVDTLTGCYNRLQYNKIIKEKIAESKRQDHSFALLYLDLDKFKSINDNLGHPVGDQLLIQVTNRLKACLRVNDFLARMGGDEFAIILSQIKNDDTVRLVSQKIIDALAAPYELDDHVVHCSSSIGIVLYPKDGTDAESLAKNADVAMYHAKSIGRNAYQFYRNLAQQDQVIEQENKINLLNCQVNNTFICIPLQYIKKNLLLPKLEYLPNSRHDVVGLMNVAGESIAVVDLGARLKLERSRRYDLATPILLCQEHGHQVGFIVDKILGLYTIEPREIQQQDYNKAANSLFLASIVFDSKLSMLVNMHYLLTDVEYLEAS